MVSFKFCFLAITAAIASLVKANYYYTTNPAGQNDIVSGKTISIQWIPGTDVPSTTAIPSYNLYFMTGGNLVQTRVTNIGTFPGTQQSIPFTIPNTAPGAYFFMFVPSDGSGASWSSRFPINGSDNWYPEGVATGVDPSDASSLTNVPTDSANNSNAASNTGTAESNQSSGPNNTNDNSSNNEDSNNNNNSTNTNDNSSNEDSNNDNNSTNTNDNNSDGDSNSPKPQRTSNSTHSQTSIETSQETNSDESTDQETNGDETTSDSFLDSSSKASTLTFGTSLIAMGAALLASVILNNIIYL